MSNSKKFLVVVLVILLSTAGWFWFKQSKVKAPTNTTFQVKQTFKTYTNDEYGFSFSYPDPYEVVVVSPEEVTVGKKLYGSFDPYVSVKLIQGSAEIEIQSFEEFVIDQARLACSSESVKITILCERIDDLVKIAPYATKSGIQGQVFNLKGEEIDKATKKSQTIRRGPFYTFNTSLNTPNRMSFLMISNPVSKPPQQVNLDVIKSVVSSMTIKFAE